MRAARNRLLNKDFFLLWLGQTVSQLGNGAGFIAIMWWVQDTTGSGLALGTVAMVNGLVGVCLGPLGGVIADRFDRKQIIVLTDLFQGVIFCSLAYLGWTNRLTLTTLIALTTLSSACWSFFNPAISASIPLLVPDQQLERANSLIRVSSSVVSIMSYATGGILVALLGVPLLMLIDGVSFLCSATSEMFMVIPQVRRSRRRFNGSDLVNDLKDGLTYIKNNAVLFRIMQIGVALNFFGVMRLILLPKFVGEHMAAESYVYGYLLSARMLGALAATLILSLTSLVKGSLWLVKWSVVFQGLMLLTLPFLPPQYWVLHAGVMLAYGTLNTVFNVYLTTIIQRITKAQYRGKVFGLFVTVTSASKPVSQGLSGLAADFVSLPVLYTISSGAGTAFGCQFALTPGIETFLKGNGNQKSTANKLAQSASN